MKPQNFLLSMTIGLTQVAYLSNSLATSLECRAVFAERTLHLQNHNGKTFFEVMKTIKNQMDNDALRPFAISNWEQISQMKKEFHPDSYRKILKLFMDSEDGFLISKDPGFKNERTQLAVKKAEAALKKLVDKIAGTKVTTVDLDATKVKTDTPDLLEVVLNALRETKLIQGPRVVISAMNLSTFLAIASRSGSNVIIDENNYFVNVGYQLDGVMRNEKTGRSSSQSPEFGFNDASDTYLLTALDKMIRNAKEDPSKFFNKLFELLLESNTGNYDKLSSEEQAVLTDFLAVYTAEFRRSWMSDLESHRWMDDLLEVYLISAFGSKAGKVINKEGFSDGKATTYFAVGSDGSGIGVMRSYRRYLQQLVSQAVRESGTDIVSRIEKIIGRSTYNGDVFRQFASYINDPRNQEDIVKNRTALKAAMNDLVEFINTNDKAISHYVSQHIDKNVVEKFNARLEAKQKARDNKKKSAMKRKTHENDKVRESLRIDREFEDQDAGEREI